MLDPREPTAVSGRTDPVLSITVGALAVIALALLVAAVLATYTYSTPNVELPLIIAIALCFVVVLGANLLRLAVRHLRTGSAG
jgi:uncharacterized integral membrane protein